MLFEDTLNQEVQELLKQNYYAFMKQYEFHHLVQSRLAFECLCIISNLDRRYLSYPALFPAILTFNRAISEQLRDELDSVSYEKVAYFLLELLLDEPDIPAELIASLINWISLHDLDGSFRKSAEFQKILQNKLSKTLEADPGVVSGRLPRWIMVLKCDKDTQNKYALMTDEQKVAHVALIFYIATSKPWNNEELSLLTMIMKFAGISTSKPVCYDRVIEEVFKDETWKACLPKQFVSLFPDQQHRVAWAIFKKLEDLQQDKSKEVARWAGYFQNSGNIVSRDVLCLAVCRKYFSEEKRIYIDKKIDAWYMVLELLYFLRQYRTESLAEHDWTYIPAAAPVSNNPEMEAITFLFGIGDCQEALRCLYIGARSGMEDVQYLFEKFCEDCKIDDFEDLVPWKIKSGTKWELFGEMYEKITEDEADLNDDEFLDKNGNLILPLQYKAAQMGYIEQQYQLGYNYAYGEGVKRDYKKAAGWYLHAARYGHPQARYYLAWQYDVHFHDLWKAVFWYKEYFREKMILEWLLHQQFMNYRKARIEIDWEKYSCNIMPSLPPFDCPKISGNFYRIKKSNTSLKKLYYEATRENDMEAQYELGCFYWATKTCSNKAFFWFRKAAELGHVKAQLATGLCCFKGVGIAPNKSEAVDWYRKAAAQGNINANYNLGLCYELGEGVDCNNREAVLLYRKVAEQGHANAQYRLGRCLQKGIGIDKDENEAMKWLYRAAAQGQGDALYAIYKIGKNTGMSDNMQRFLLRKAAEHGCANAQYYYGLQQEQSFYGPGDAEVWYEAAARQGNAEAEARLGIYYFLYDKESTEKMFYTLKCAEKMHQIELMKQCKAGNLTAKEGSAERQYERAQKYIKLIEDLGDTEEDALRKLAAKWYHRAALQGYADAQYEYGRCCEEGFGEDKEEDARKWYFLAAMQGQWKAMEKIESVVEDWQAEEAQIDGYID